MMYPVISDMCYSDLYVMTHLVRPLHHVSPTHPNTALQVEQVTRSDHNS